MKPILTWMILLVSLLLTCCSPNAYFEQSPSVNLVHFKTYAFLPKVDSAKVSIYDSGIIDELIHKSIVAELNSPGSVITANSFRRIEYKEGLLIIDFFVRSEDLHGEAGPNVILTTSVNLNIFCQTWWQRFSATIPSIPNNISFPKGLCLDHQNISQ